jgi:hypothetical protein
VWRITPAWALFAQTADGFSTEMGNCSEWFVWRDAFSGGTQVMMKVFSCMFRDQNDPQNHAQQLENLPVMMWKF